MGTHKEFTRQGLYDLVWTTPMTVLGKQFGMSDVGVRKICVKYRIPTPPPGYWAKLQFGKAVRKIPLATANGVGDRIRISITEATDAPEAVIIAAEAARSEVAGKVVVPIEMPRKLHRIASVTKRALTVAKPNHEGFVGAGSAEDEVAVQVGKSSVGRVAIMLDTIARTLEELGHGCVDAKDGVDLVINGEKLRLSFHEGKDKHVHHPTSGELAEKAMWEENRAKWPALYNADRRHWRSWDHSPSGRLSLVLHSPTWTNWQSDRLLGRWHDKKSAALEQQLDEVIIAMHAGSALLRHNREAAEERERRRQEEADHRRREQELQERVDKREVFVRQKSKEFADLVELRRFSGHLDETAHASGMPHASAIASVAREMVRRLEASFCADRLDCEIRRLDLYLDGDEMP